MTLKSGETGRCPHCKTGVRFEDATLRSNRGAALHRNISFETPSGYTLGMEVAACPGCGRPIVTATYEQAPEEVERHVDALLWPDGSARIVPPEVESEAPELAADFREAGAVFAKSKKACAALARRCLQFILRDKAGTKSRDLAGQIDEVLSSLPSELAANVDAIRHVGNFGAHPMKSTNSGEIADVEEGEAEWLLDVLEELMDFYYVAPAAAAAKRAALNAKLQDLGKPPLKSPKS